MVYSFNSNYLNYYNNNSMNYSLGQNINDSLNNPFEMYKKKDNKHSSEHNDSLYWGLAAVTTIAALAALTCFHKPTNIRLKSVWSRLFGKTTKAEAKAAESLEKSASPSSANTVNTLFNKLRGLKGTNFANAVAEYRAEEIGLKGLKFDIIPVKQSERLKTLGDSSAIGLCDADAQKIYILEDVINGKDNKKLLETIAHEMEHVNQTCMIARTSGLGIDSMARAEANRYVAFLKSENPAQESKYLMQQWELARKLPPQSFEQIRTAKYNEYLKEFSQNNVYQTAIKNKGMIASGTPEAEKAKAYLREIEHQPDSINSQEYRDSISEQDAYAVGHKYVRDYEFFLNS